MEIQPTRPKLFSSHSTDAIFARLIEISQARADRFASDVALDGLNVAVGAHTPGNMVAKDWNAVLYIDERATEAQRNA